MSHTVSACLPCLLKSVDDASFCLLAVLLARCLFQLFATIWFHRKRRWKGSVACYRNVLKTHVLVYHIRPPGSQGRPALLRGEENGRREGGVSRGSGFSRSVEARATSEELAETSGDESTDLEAWQVRANQELRSPPVLACTPAAL